MRRRQGRTLVRIKDRDNTLAAVAGLFHSTC